MRARKARAPRRAAALAAALLLAAAACAAQSPADPRGAWGDRLYGAEEAGLPVARELLLEGFDGGTPWRATMAAEDGAATARLFPAAATEGGPPSALGLRVDFLRRSASSLLLLAPRPIPVEGDCASISLRVLGRSFRHELYLVLLDYYGRERELRLGELDFAGWRTMRAYLPARDPAAGYGIVQDDPHYLAPPGLRVAGLRLRFEPEEAYGSLYVYFDELKAVSRIVSTEEAPPPPAAPPAIPKAPAPAAEVPEAPAPAAEPPPPAPPAESAPARVLALISERLAAALVYPPAARRRGLEGSLVAAFVVAADGSLASASVAESSGSDILDKAGLELLRSVFPAPNDSGGPLSLRIRIAYRLQPGP